MQLGQSISSARKRHQASVAAFHAQACAEAQGGAMPIAASSVTGRAAICCPSGQLAGGEKGPVEEGQESRQRRQRRQ
jgi:hypothetical protein